MDQGEGEEDGADITGCSEQMQCAAVSADKEGRTSHQLLEALRVSL